MTIISAVYVPEGIAMAADSRLTGTRRAGERVEHFTVTDNAQKLILVRNETIAISFSGDAIIDNKTVADFLRIFDIEKIQESDTVSEVANKLKQYLEEEYQQYDVVFIVAGFDNDIPFVFTVHKNAVTLENSNEDGSVNYGALWRGETDPLNKLLSNFSFNADLTPLKDAADFAEFLVELTVKYTRFEDKISTCGGPIDIVVITKDYIKFLKHKILQP